MGLTVSVIVTTYNQSRYIEDTLRSVFNQTYPPLEVIVVDDGSTDDTPERLARVGEKIRHIRQKNQGVASSRNTGVAHAQGQYVAFLDGDDLWEPEKLAVQIAAATECPQSGLIAVDGVEFDDHGVLQPSLLRDVRKELGIKDDQIVNVPYYEHSLDGCPIWTVSQVMIPRSVLHDVGPSDRKISWGSDYDLYLRIAEKHDVTFITKRLVKWRYLATSASGPHELRVLRYGLDHILVLKKQLQTASKLRRALIKNILDRRIPLESESAYYYGRRHDRALAMRVLWRLARGRAPFIPLVYLVALWIPSLITRGAAPAIRRIFGLSR